MTEGSGSGRGAVDSSVPSSPETEEGLVPLLDRWPDGPALVGRSSIRSCIVGAVGRKA